MHNNDHLIKFVKCYVCSVRIVNVTQSSRYDQITQAIGLLKAQIEEENREQSGKYQLIGMKITMIEEQTSESTQFLMNYCIASVIKKKKPTTE